MMELFALNKFWLHMLQFVCFSSLLFGSVWALELSNVIKSVNMRFHLWRLALFASLILLLPVSGTLGPKIYLESQSAERIAALSSGIQTPSETGMSYAAAPASSPYKTGETTTRKADGAASHAALPYVLLALWFSIAGMALYGLARKYRRAINALGPRKRLDRDDHIFRALSDMCKAAGIKSIPRLTRSAAISSPLSLLGREICLPVWVDSSLPENELRSLLAHELAHIQHRDPQLLIALHILSRLFFFQPLFLLATKRLIDFAEFRADQWAAEQGSKARDVAIALVNCASRSRNTKDLQYSLAMADSGSRLKQRVAQLLSGKNALHPQSPRAKMLSYGVLAAFILLMPTLRYGHASEFDEHRMDAALSDILLSMSDAQTGVADFMPGKEAKGAQKEKPELRMKRNTVKKTKKPDLEKKEDVFPCANPN